MTTLLLNSNNSNILSFKILSWQGEAPFKFPFSIWTISTENTFFQKWFICEYWCPWKGQESFYYGLHNPSVLSLKKEYWNLQVTSFQSLMFVLLVKCQYHNLIRWVIMQLDDLHSGSVQSLINIRELEQQIQRNVFWLPLNIILNSSVFL